MTGRRRVSKLAGALVAGSVAAIALPATALAHFGLPPGGRSLALPPSDNPTILLPVTFGKLISTDGGETFYWICDTAAGLDPISLYDPDHAVAADGTIFITTTGAGEPYPAPKGLRISRDGGCTFTLAGGLLEDRWVDRIEIGSNGWVWAATAEGDVPNDVFVSKDNGETFAEANLHLEGGWFKSIRIAPSDPLRVYISAYKLGDPDVPDSQSSALLYRSDDGGETWQTLPVDDFTFDPRSPQLYVMGVSPVDPDIVFARVVDIGDAPIDNDVLYRSTDGGQTWTDVLVMGEEITAFVIRRDGTTVIAGTKEKGVRISSDGGVTWEEPTQQPEMACLGEAADGTLYACGNNWEPDLFALATSTDGQTWDGILRFNELTPLQCDPGTVQHDVCATSEWEKECPSIGACPPAPDAMTDAGAGGDAGGGDGDGDDSCGGCSAGSLAFLIVLWPLGPRRRHRTR